MKFVWTVDEILQYALTSTVNITVLLNSVNCNFYFYSFHIGHAWDTGIRGLMRGLAILLQPLMVKDKV